MVRNGNPATHSYAYEKQSPECGSYATLEEVFEALYAKYGLTIREANLTN